MSGIAESCLAAPLTCSMNSLRNLVFAESANSSFLCGNYLVPFFASSCTFKEWETERKRRLANLQKEMEKLERVIAHDEDYVKRPGDCFAFPFGLVVGGGVIRILPHALCSQAIQNRWPVTLHVSVLAM